MDRLWLIMVIESWGIGDHFLIRSILWVSDLCAEICVNFFLALLYPLYVRYNTVGLKIEVHKTHEMHQDLRNPMRIINKNPLSATNSTSMKQQLSKSNVSSQGRSQEFVSEGTKECGLTEVTTDTTDTTDRN